MSLKFVVWERVKKRNAVKNIFGKQKRHNHTVWTFTETDENETLKKSVWKKKMLIARIFPLFPQCFQKPSLVSFTKVGILL